MIKKIHGEKIKNILRSFEPENGQNLKNTQAEIQISWSYKKKTCIFIFVIVSTDNNLSNKLLHLFHYPQP